MYPLIDTSAQEKFDFTLAEALEKAKKGPLLKGISFIGTPSVTPDSTTLGSIIRAAGGKWIEKPNKTDYIEFTKKNCKEPNKFIFISTPEEREAMLDKKVRVYSSELLLTGVLRQSLPLNDPDVLL